MGRKKKIRKNTNKIEDKLKNFDENNLNRYIKENLSGYRANAIRLAVYYGNLRIRYVGFNFTLIAFFASILAFYIPLVVGLDTSILKTSLPLIIGFITYLVPFLYFLIRGYKTIAFGHSNLDHYSIFMKTKDYPKIEDHHLDEFINLIKENVRNYSIKDDLKSLILQYIYQANYNKRAVRIRWCLIFGFIDLVITLTISVVWLTIVFPLL